MRADKRPVIEEIEEVPTLPMNVQEQNLNNIETPPQQNNNIKEKWVRNLSKRTLTPTEEKVLTEVKALPSLQKRYRLTNL